MLTQIKYALRIHSTLRWTSFVVMAVLGLVFTALSWTGVMPFGGRITGISLTGTALGVLAFICLIADIEAVRTLYSAPIGYNSYLVPIPFWKVLLARILTVTVQDVVAIAVGTVLVTIQAFLLTDLSFGFIRLYFGEILWSVLVLLAGYIYLFLFLVFLLTLRKSLFYSMRAKTLLAVGATLAVGYVYNLLNFAVAPFVQVWNFGLYFQLTIGLGPNPGLIVFLVLMVAKCAGLFFASAYLMERKMNI